MTTQTSPQASKTKNAIVGRFILLALLWGSSFTFIKVSLEGLTPGQLVLTRLVLGAAVLLGIARLRKVALPRWGGIWGHVAGPPCSQRRSVPAVVIRRADHRRRNRRHFVGSTPLLTLALATAALPTERATPRKAVGLVFGFVGLMLVIGPSGRARLARISRRTAGLPRHSTQLRGRLRLRAQVPVRPRARPAIAGRVTTRRGGGTSSTRDPVPGMAHPAPHRPGNRQHRVPRSAEHRLGLRAVLPAHRRRRGDHRISGQLRGPGLRGPDQRCTARRAGHLEPPGRWPGSTHQHGVRR